MATSKLFDGVDDVMVYGSPPQLLGAYSLLIVCKIIATNDTTWMSLIENKTSGGAGRTSLGRRASLGDVYISNNGGIDSSNAVVITDADGWMIICGTKATGSAIPTFHKVIIGGARTTNAGVGAIGNDLSYAGGNLRIGGNDDFANIEVACAAIFDKVLTTTELDGINTAKTSASILALAPVWMVDASDGLVTDQTAGTADRTAVTGTTAGASDPSGWAYLGSGTNATIVAPAAGGTGSGGAPLPTVTILPAARVGTASRVAPNPILVVPAAFAAGTASRVAPLPLATVAPAAMASTASRSIPTIVKSPLPISPAASATASRPTTLPMITILPAASAATASTVAPLPNMLVGTVPAIATASRVAPTPLVTIAPAAMAATASRNPTVQSSAHIVFAVPFIANAGMRLKEPVPPAAAVASRSVPQISKVAPLLAPAALATAVGPVPSISIRLTPPAATATGTWTGARGTIVDLSYDDAAGGGLLLGLAGFEGGVTPRNAVASRPAPVVIIMPVAVAATATASRVAPTIVASTAATTIPTPAALSAASRAIPTPTLTLAPAAAQATAQRGATPAVTVISPAGLATAAGLVPVGNDHIVDAVASVATASRSTPILALTLVPAAELAIAASVAPDVQITVVAPVTLATAVQPAPVIINTAQTLIAPPAANAVAIITGVEPVILLSIPPALGIAVNPPTAVAITVVPTASTATASIDAPITQHSGAIVAPVTLAFATRGPVVPRISIGPSSHASTASRVAPTLSTGTLTKTIPANADHLLISTEEDLPRMLSGKV